jgi:hypothetical protein
MPAGSTLGGSHSADLDCATGFGVEAAASGNVATSLEAAAARQAAWSRAA